MKIYNKTIFNKLLKFTKIEHTIFSLPFLFAGAWLGAGGMLPSWKTLILIFFAGIGARIMGMAMNRILDRDLDALNPRTANREIPRGSIALSSAYLVALIGFLLYFSACAMLGRLALLLSPIPPVFLIAYSLLKRFTCYCHLGVGACLGLAPIGAYIAASGAWPHEAHILLLMLFTFCWMSGFDIIYALQDIEFDRQKGVHSIPAVFGSKGAQIVAAGIHLLALLSAYGLLVMIGNNVFAWLAFFVSASAFILAYIPLIPLSFRFFPVSAIAGISGAMIPLMWVGS